jgi:hypothetical protein
MSDRLTPSNLAPMARRKTRSASARSGRHVAALTTPVSATILPFARPQPRSTSITQAERAQSAAWAAFKAFSLGGTWWVETHLTDDGTTWLGLVTPSSRVSGGEASLAWLIERTGRGVELTRSMTWKTQVFHSVTEALASAEAAEKMFCTAA